MTRSSLTVAALALGMFAFGSLACGDHPPPKPPESTPAASTDTDGGAASPASTDTDGGATTGSAGGEAPPAAPAALALPTGSAKLKFKAKKDFDVELKSDGTVNSGGKPAAKIMGMELQSADGKSQLKVDADGNVMTADGAPYAKFEGDDLAAQNGVKYMIGDDGSLSQMNEKGAKTAMGKADGVGSAKRAALLSVAYVMWGTKAPAAKAGGKGGEKKGEKPAGEKKPAKK